MSNKTQNKNNMSILRMSVESKCIVDRADFDSYLKSHNFNQTVQSLIPERHTADAVRAAISNVLSQCKTILHDGERLRFIKCPAKTASNTEIKFDIHLQKKSSDVDYIRLGSFYYNGNQVEWIEDSSFPTELVSKLPTELTNWTANPDGLIEYGRKLFSSDVRRIVDLLLVEKLPQLWKGTFLVISEEYERMAMEVSGLLETVSRNCEGRAVISLLSILNSAENRKVLAADMTEVFSQRLDSLSEEIDTILAKGLELDLAIKKVEDKRGDYANLFNEAAGVQDALDCDFGDAWYESIARITEVFEIFDAMVENEKNLEKDNKEKATV